MWLLVQRRIQSRSVLRKKHIVQDATCQVCNASEETPDHIIGGCAIAVSFWKRLNLNSMVGIQHQNLPSVTPSPGILVDEFPAFLALACWEIWKLRNAKVFRQENVSAVQLLSRCKSAAQLWSHGFSAKKRHIPQSWCSYFQMARNLLL